MTEKQREYLNLYTSGHTISAIARAMGKGKSTVSSAIKRAKESLNSEQKPKGQPCPYSPSCFTCPLRDCVIDPAKATSLNII